MRFRYSYAVKIFDSEGNKVIENSQKNYAVAALGAGDLIDRAIRFYRNNFWTFVWIAAPPVLFGTLFSIIWTMLGREIFALNSTGKAEDFFLSQLFTFLGNSVIWLFEMIAALSIMGGASRNFVRHTLFGEPVTFRETYLNTFRRIGGLFVASFLIVVILGFIGGTVFYIGLTVGVLAIAAVAYMLSFSSFLTFTVSFLLFLAALFATGWLFFLIAARFAYVPQVMLVEGQGVFSAMGRSMNLASANVKRIYALFVFTFVATYSALALFYIPLSIYAYSNGIEIWSFDIDAIPAWYSITTQVISQVSLILLLPVWMIGLCLLYVDERVRHEGYDIELLAARRLGEIPAVPQRYTNPLQPALAMQNASPPTDLPDKNSPFTTLGLN